MDFTRTHLFTSASVNLKLMVIPRPIQGSNIKENCMTELWQSGLVLKSFIEIISKDLRTFALIVSAHPSCARKFTWHVMHLARALSTKMNNNRARWPLLKPCLDLTILDVRLLLFFFSETDYIYNYLHIVQKWAKNQCEKLKKIKISVHGTWNYVILRLQGAWNCGRYMRTCSLRNLASWLNSLNRST